MIKKYALYLIRWQLSTPILAVVLIVLSNMSTIWATIIANLIGGLIFFWVDRFIFRSMSHNPLWEIRDDVKCADCGKVGDGYRIAEWMGYNRKDDKNPEFRCEHCRDIKKAEVHHRIKKKKG
jgi:DNA-directed RNA polymerase subunit RPC12/RpoP